MCPNITFSMSVAAKLSNIQCCYFCARTRHQVHPVLYREEFSLSPIKTGGNQFFIFYVGITFVQKCSKGGKPVNKTDVYTLSLLQGCQGSVKSVQPTKPVRSTKLVKPYIYHRLIILDAPVKRNFILDVLSVLLTICTTSTTKLNQCGKQYILKLKV